MKKFIYCMLIVFCSALFVSCSENYSNGERIGTVVQFSKTGLIWNSWEGQLNLTQTGMNTSGEPFEFSFDNDLDNQDSLINLVNEAQAKGWKIKLVYHEVMGWNWFQNRGNTNHFITDVKIVDKNFAKPLENLSNDNSSTISKDSAGNYILGSKENPIHIVIDNK